MIGSALGILVVKSRPRSGMGWDQIADAIGALALGGGVGCVTCVVLAALASERRALKLGVVLIVLGPLLLVLAARVPSRRAPVQPVRPPFEPTFVVQMFTRIAAGDPGPPPGESFPHRELRVDARTWTLSTKGWGPAVERPYCSAELSADDLARLGEPARRIFEQGVRNCPAAGSAIYSVQIEWSGDTRGTASFGLACLDQQPAMAEFLETFDQVREEVCS